MQDLAESLFAGGDAAPSTGYRVRQRGSKTFLHNPDGHTLAKYTGDTLCLYLRDIVPGGSDHALLVKILGVWSGGRYHQLSYLRSEGYWLGRAAGEEKRADTMCFRRQNSISYCFAHNLPMRGCKLQVAVVRGETRCTAQGSLIAKNDGRLVIFPNDAKRTCTLEFLKNIIRRWHPDAELHQCGSTRYWTLLTWEVSHTFFNSLLLKEDNMSIVQDFIRRTPTIQGEYAVVRQHEDTLLRRNHTFAKLRGDCLTIYPEHANIDNSRATLREAIRQWLPDGLLFSLKKKDLVWRLTVSNHAGDQRVVDCAEWHDIRPENLPQASPQAPAPGDARISPAAAAAFADAQEVTLTQLDGIICLPAERNAGRLLPVLSQADLEDIARRQLNGNNPPIKIAGRMFEPSDLCPPSAWEEHLQEVRVSLSDQYILPKE